MVSVILELVLYNMTRLSFGNILVVSLTVTVLSYLVGDLLILKYTNNIVATLADVGLALVTVYLFNFFYYRPGISFVTALITAVIVGIGEWVFHKFVFRILQWSDVKKTKEI